MDVPWRREFDAARDPYTARVALGITTAGGGGPFQPLDADLTAIAGLTGINVIYYRSAADTWSAVTIGSGLIFSGGTLSATAGPTYNDEQAQDATAAAFAAGTHTAITVTYNDTANSLSLANTDRGSTAVTAHEAAADPHPQYLTTAEGAAAYQPLDADLTALAGIAGVQGDIIYRNASVWTRLAAGTSGQFLQTLGGGTNPQWATLAGGGNVSNSGTPTAGQIARWTDATHIEGVSTAGLGITPACGRLTYVGPTQLKFSPFGGDRIKVNGVLWQIPAAGIPGLANTGIFLNNVGGQNLAANTTYWVFAFNNGGTLTGHFWSVAGGLAAPHHAPSAASGNEGTEVFYNGTFLEQFSLIGVIRTNASAQFVDSTAVRGVLSWFNRRPIIAQGKFTAYRSTTSATFVEINSEIAVGFLTWGESAVVLNISGSMSNVSGPGSGTTALAVDGTNLTGTQIGTSAATNHAVAVNITAALGGLDTVSEGYHTASLYGQANAGTQTWFGGNVQGACTLTAQIMG